MGTPKVYKTLNLRNDLMEFNSYRDESFRVDRYNDYFNEFPDLMLPAHWHDEFEIDIIINGSATYYINGNPHCLNKGDTILINSGRTHYAIGKSENSKALGIIFNPETISPDLKSIIYRKYFHDFISSEVDTLILSPSESDDEWQTVYDIYSLDEDDPLFEIHCLELILKIWQPFYRKFESMKEPAVSQDNRSEALMKMITYMHDHYSEKITVEELAALAGISSSSCFRLFKQYTAYSPLAYLNDYRLRRSALDLSVTKKSVTEIAADYGFDSPSYFSLLFSRKYRISPLKYRNSQLR